MATIPLVQGGFVLTELRFAMERTLADARLQPWRMCVAPVKA
jgi:hypothetical protein